MHTETAVEPSTSFSNHLYDHHENCPNCGGEIGFPVAAVHSDGTQRGYCAACRTEVFEASYSH